MSGACTAPPTFLLIALLASSANSYDVVLDPGGCTPQEELSSSATLVECEALALAGGYSHFIRFRNEASGLCSGCPDGHSESPALTFYTLYRVTMPPSPPPGPPGKLEC